MSWHCKNTGGYSINSIEAEENAIEIWNLCYSLGWTRASVAAMLGNIGGESVYTPWRWQGDVVLPVGDPGIGTIGGGNTAHAYGLCQQDPAAKYIYRTYAQMQNGFGPNFSDQPGSVYDGYAQIMYLHWICSQNAAGGEWLPDSPYAQGLGLPFEDFIANTPGYTYNQLTRTFFGCYERGTWNSNRVLAAEYWSAELSNYVPQPPPVSGDEIWFAVFKIISKRKKGVIGYSRKPKNGGVIR